MPKVPPKPGPRKSNTGTPIPAAGVAGEIDPPTLAERLDYAEFPRPFKRTHFTSKLPYRTASTSTTTVKKNVKQILVLERERIGGGDGFLTAHQTSARARGEVLELGGKKKKSTPINGVPNKRGFNLKNRGSKSAANSGVGTPMTLDDLESGQTTPAVVDDEEGDGDGEGEGGDGAGANEGGVRKEVFTYHTPAAPPSLLPTKKYCDITGLHANYTDPRTKLRYKGLDVWHVVRSLGPGGDQAYLALRGAQTSLK